LDRDAKKIINSQPILSVSSKEKVSTLWQIGTYRWLSWREIELREEGATTWES
jgi:hypothetical protein